MTLASGGHDTQDHDIPPADNTLAFNPLPSSVEACQHLAVIRPSALGAATPDPWCSPAVMTPKPELF